LQLHFQFTNAVVAPVTTLTYKALNTHKEILCEAVLLTCNRLQNLSASLWWFGSCFCNYARYVGIT
jgi:hypothetical protein